MLNPVEMIADVVKRIDDFKKENIDALQKAYDEKMGKIKEMEEELSEIPVKYIGKSKTFIEKKRKQLEKKIEDLTRKVDEWFEQKKKESLDKIEKMLKDQKDAIMKAKQEEDDNQKESSKLASDISK